MDRTIKYILSAWALLFTYSAYYLCVHIYKVESIRSGIALDYARHNLQSGDDLVRINSTIDYLYFPFYDGGFVGNMCSVVFVCTIGLCFVYIFYKLLIYSLNYFPGCKL